MKRDRKRRIESFRFNDFEAIEAHLNKMAQKGWHIEKITPFYWQYKRIDPVDRHYTITYFAQASDFSPYPSSNQEMFYDYCNECGYQLAVTWAQMQIFYTDSEDAIPIETDEALKLNSIHHAMKKNFLPSTVVLIVLAIFQILMQVSSIIRMPIMQLSNNVYLSVIFAWSIVGISGGISLVSYFKWWRDSKKATSIGGTCLPTKGHRHLNLVLLLLSLGVLLWMLMTLYEDQLIWIGIASVGQITMVIFGVNFVKNKLKAAGVSRKTNMTVTVISAIVLSFIMMGLLTTFVFKLVDYHRAHQSTAVERTFSSPNGTKHTWYVHDDPMPLIVEQFKAIDFPDYSYEAQDNNSILLRWRQYDQRDYTFNPDIPTMYYEIIDVKFDWLFDYCLNYYLQQYVDDYAVEEGFKTNRYREIDASLWQADVAYQLYYGDEPSETFLFCKGNRIVKIGYDWMPTEAEMTFSSEQLLNE
ncbi:DUF2812 domain-containing protein [Fusibacter paucivorans]|uniref:DUF2812 domain-containing protein n=1 Tax=Fusibacter paucivorans TaxID=76009 RepID=A0ABS5PTP2_9FIRM|nr:DUF2812 domain-containing protein [Fusibacter paucivorans]MBS7528540.1 DUF2812 domain-containing protein [Fusibacter paucivorans]